MHGMTVAGARRGSQENGSAFRLPSAEQPFVFSGTAGPAGEKLPSVLHLYRSVFGTFRAPLFSANRLSKKDAKINPFSNYFLNFFCEFLVFLRVLTRLIKHFGRQSQEAADRYRIPGAFRSRFHGDQTVIHRIFDAPQAVRPARGFRLFG